MFEPDGRRQHFAHGVLRPTRHLTSSTGTRARARRGSWSSLPAARPARYVRGCPSRCDRSRARSPCGRSRRRRARPRHAQPARRRLRQAWPVPPAAPFRLPRAVGRDLIAADELPDVAAQPHLHVEQVQLDIIGQRASGRAGRSHSRPRAANTRIHRPEPAAASSFILLAPPCDRRRPTFSPGSHYVPRAGPRRLLDQLVQAVGGRTSRGRHSATERRCRWLAALRRSPPATGPGRRPR